MTTTATSIRQRRARVLCIGLNNSSEMLQNCLAQPPVLVHNIFEAMGELSAAPSDRPIHAAVIAGSALRGASADAVDALRDIDPSVRIVLVNDTNDAQHMADRSDLFSAILPAPLSPTALAGALDNGAPVICKPTEKQATIPPPVAPVESKPQNVSQPAPAAPAPNTPPPPPVSKPAPAPTRAPAVEVMTTPATIDRPGKKDVDASTETLGDVDLVESIIHHDGRLRELALRLIAQQTGWSDVTLHPIDQFIEGASAAVSFDNQTFGILTSQSTDARALKPWADWLARWLALDDSHTQLRHMAYSDDLTGAWNRRFFNEFLGDALVRARELRLPVTVMVFDIDDFKIYNDRYSHEAGDEILVETVRLLESVIRKSDRVCRIGGDEFAVIFADLDGPRAAGSSHPDAVGEIASRFQKQICSMRFPKLANEAPGTLTISAGLSTFPWDGDKPDELLRLADIRAMHSKRSGKNVITYGPEK